MEGGNGTPRRTLKTDSLIAQVVVRAVWELLCRKKPEGWLRIVLCAQAHTLSYLVACSGIQTNKTVVHRPGLHHQSTNVLGQRGSVRGVSCRFFNAIDVHRLCVVVTVRRTNSKKQQEASKSCCWVLHCSKESEGLLRIVMCAQAHTRSYSVVCSVIQTNKTDVHWPTYSVNTTRFLLFSCCSAIQSNKIVVHRPSWLYWGTNVLGTRSSNTTLFA